MLGVLEQRQRQLEQMHEDTDDGVMGWIVGCRWGYKGSSASMPMAQNCKSLTREKELKGPTPCFPSLTDRCLTAGVFVRCLCPWCLEGIETETLPVMAKASSPRSSRRLGIQQVLSVCLKMNEGLDQ